MSSGFFETLVQVDDSTIGAAFEAHPAREWCAMHKDAPLTWRGTPGGLRR
jgi:hypothetical protein